MKGILLIPPLFFFGLSVAGTVTVFPGDCIQDSLETLSSGDSLYLSPGIYTDSTCEPVLSCGPLQSGVSIVSHPTDRAVLNGEGMERSVIALNGPVTSPVFLANLVITGGNAVSPECFNGGGIFSGETDAVVSNCLVTGNSALIGGGVGAEGGSLTLIHTDISGNQAAVTGGGIDIYACSFTGFMLRFTDNESSDDGGGFNGYQSSITMENAVFTGNYSGDDGGGLCILQGTSALEYLTVYGNEAHDDGGGLRIHTVDSLFLTSSIVVSNLGKAGINVISDNKPVVSHVCCWNNEFSNYNGMEDPTGASGNISVDPLFADSMLNLSQVSSGQSENSPAVDAGHEDAGDGPVAGLSTRTDSVPDQGVSDMGFHHINRNQTGTPADPLFQSVTISPSPFSEFSTVTVRGLSGVSADFLFYDIAGRLLNRISVPVDGSGTAIYRISPATGLHAGPVLFKAVWQYGEASGRSVVLP